LQLLRDGLSIAEAIQHRQWMSAAHLGLGALYLDLLALPEARQHLEQALALAREIGSLYWIHLSNSLLVSTCLAQAAPASAQAFLDAVFRLDMPMQSTGQRGSWYARAELALAQGDPNTSLRIVNHLMASTGNIYDEQALPALTKLRGDCFAALGQAAAAETAFRAAGQGARRQGRPPLLWRIHTALGHLYLAEHRPDEAEREFAAARDLVQELAGTLPDQTLRDTFVHGALALMPPPIATRHTVGSVSSNLTAREVDVLRLIAEGKSNQEIAADLVLSIRTVERHISTIYEKLGVSGRAARASATAYALRHDLMPPPAH
jgi:DNA-binding CsgD family transcriptional regulator